MTVLRDIPISLELDAVLAKQKARRQRPVMVKAAQRAIDLAQPLYAPAFVYAELEIQEIKHERVTLFSSNGQKELHIGPHVDLLAPASMLLAVVSTIGPALEERVDQLNQDGDSLTAYWLDIVGVLALGKVGEVVRRLVEERAAQRDWGVGITLSPGALIGWPLRGQREIGALLPLDDIGVRLSKNCVLEPHKSTSVAIGIGPGYESRQLGSACHLCVMKGDCWRR